MSITTEIRDEALELLDKLAKSDSKEWYDYFYLKLCDTMPEPIIDYFDDNWHENREEWVR